METSRQVRLALQAMAYNSSNDLGSFNNLASMGVFNMITTVIFMVIALCIGIVWGRAAEGAKRDRGEVTPFSLDQAQRQGYLRARINVDPTKMLTMDEMLLALHRQEGLLGAINDNYHDLHIMAKKYGAEK